MAKVILFDVNETLLDLRALNPHFARVFGSANVMNQWFAQVLRSALVVTITDTYQDFGVIAGDALEMMALRDGVKLTDADRAAILTTMRSLPPHPEVPESLARLRDAGLRLAALTNSPPHVLREQMNNAGLTEYFEQLLSVDPTRKFKPACEPYLHAAEQLGVEPAEICMVAAHDWDIAGAMQVGLAGAFIARPGMVLGSLHTKPGIIGANLAEVVDQILAQEMAS